MSSLQAVEGEAAEEASLRRQQAGTLPIAIFKLERRRRNHLVEKGCDLLTGKINHPPIALIQQSNRLVQ